MWLTLTLFNDKPVRVNMNHVLSYYADKDFTEIDFGFSSCKVKETIEEIVKLKINMNGGWK